jgi:L-ascorbate metabolism protein UlaG (beta-lactamase superfamily)
MPRRDRPTSPPSHTEARITLRERATLIARGTRSMLSRYPTDLAHAFRATLSPAATPSGVDPIPSTLDADWPRDREGSGLQAACWLGHCSVLLKLGPLTILADPVLGPTIGPIVRGKQLGPRRLLPPAPAIEHLPRPDLVLVSHAHYDHLDRPTLATLVSPHTELITARFTRSLIPRGFRHIHELRWDRSLTIDCVTITAVRPRHWGARSGWDRHRGYNSYILEHANTRILFAADTADTRRFDKLGPFDMGIFGIGAYDPWHHAHATPEQVWRMATESGCRFVLPVHYLTFKLSDEPMEEPLTRLLDVAGPERHRVLAVEPGVVMRL